MPVHCEIESQIFYYYHIELDQFHTFENPIDKLVSSHFCGIELNEECDFDPQICDPVQIPESLLTPVILPNLSNILESVLIPIIPELESLLFESHIPSWGNNCGLEFHLLDLDPLPEPISTPEPLLDLSHFSESVLVPVLPESKSIIPLWDKVVDKFDSEIILKIWKLDGVKLLIKIIHIYIILVGYILEISGGFLRTPRKNDWVAFRGPIRPPPEPPP